MAQAITSREISFMPPGHQTDCWRFAAKELVIPEVHIQESDIQRTIGDAALFLFWDCHEVIDQKR